MRKILLFSLLCMFSIQVFSQNVTEIDKELPNEIWDMTLGNQQGRAVAIDGDYAAISSDGYDGDYELVNVIRKNGSDWEKIATLKASDNMEDDFFGHTLSISGDNIVVGAYGDDDNGSSSGSVYVFVKPEGGWVDMTETAKLKASDGGVENQFGVTISISGDNIVVGCQKDTAYVFSKPINGWVDMTETATLTASDGAIYDYFGRSVSISGDNIVVGAPGNDDNGNNNGAAYVFTKPTGGWTNMTEIAKLTVSDGSADGRFGTGVAISNDKIVVGATSTVAAYIFEKPEGGWVNMTEIAKLTPSEGMNSRAGFGRIVSISGKTVVVAAPGDYSYVGRAYFYREPAEGWSDMVRSTIHYIYIMDYGEYYGCSIDASENTLIVGSYGKTTTDNNFNSGISYIHTYDESTGSLYKEEILVSTYDSVSQSFGQHVSIDGDYAVISTSSYDVSTGYAYVYHNSEGLWEKVATLTPSIRKSHSSFGSSVSISGDVIVVGASEDFESGEEWYAGSGAVYVYVKPDEGWFDMKQTARLTSSDRAANDYFGISVSISGNNIVVGARGDDDNGNFSGSAYVFTKPVEGWIDMTETAKLLPSDGAVDQEFGKQLNISDDNIIFGVDRDDDNGTYSGSAYIFTKPENGWTNMTETAKLFPSDGREYGFFGHSVSISDDVAVISGYYYDERDDRLEGAYVFTKPEGGWSNINETAKLIPSDAFWGQGFGLSTSISGDMIALGAQQDEANGTNSGSAYVFMKPENGWTDTTQTAKLIASDGATGDNFGVSVGISGDAILVGSTGNDEKANNAGAAYFYKKANVGIVNQPVDQRVNLNTEGAFSIIATNANNFKWQRSYDDGVTFNDITDDNIYSGSQTATLNVVAFESISNQKYRCIVSNSWGEVISIVATLTLNHSPSNIELSNNTIDEGLAIGITVGTLTATDDDTGDTHAFSFVTGDGTNDAGNSSFTIENDILKSNAEFDYETQLEYNIYVQVQDNGGLSFEKAFIVNIIDVNSVPSNIELSNNTIDEGLAIGTTVGTFTATDDDTDDTHTFLLVTGDGTNDAGNSSFTIENDILKSNAEFDYETQSEYNIFVEVTDEGGLSFQKTFVIDINDITETGLSTLEQNGISIYPNPTNGIMNLSFSDNKTYIVKIYDLLGNILFDRNDVVQSKMIDISECADGVYIMSIQNGDKIITSKIIKR